MTNRPLLTPIKITRSYDTSFPFKLPLFSQISQITPIEGKLQPISQQPLGLFSSNQRWKHRQRGSFQLLLTLKDHTIISHEVIPSAIFPIIQKSANFTKGGKFHPISQQPLGQFTPNKGWQSRRIGLYQLVLTSQNHTILSCHLNYPFSLKFRKLPPVGGNIHPISQQLLGQFTPNKGRKSRRIGPHQLVLTSQNHTIFFCHLNYLISLKFRKSPQWGECSPHISTTTGSIQTKQRVVISTDRLPLTSIKVTKPYDTPLPYKLPHFSQISQITPSGGNVHPISQPPPAQFN